MFKQAFALLEKKDDPVSLGYLYAASGDKREALRFAAILEGQSKQKYVRQETIARIYAALDDLVQAFRWLDMAFEERSVDMLNLKVSPDWDHLRTDPRFQALLDKMNFPK